MQILVVTIGKVKSGQLLLVDLIMQWLKQPTCFCSVHATGICCMMLVNIDFEDKNLKFYYKQLTYNSPQKQIGCFNHCVGCRRPEETVVM